MVGFIKGDELLALYKSVDVDGSGTLDFSEFVCLLVLSQLSRFESLLRVPACTAPVLAR
jgi:hypothetical protein